MEWRPKENKTGKEREKVSTKVHYAVEHHCGQLYLILLGPFEALP